MSTELRVMAFQPQIPIAESAGKGDEVIIPFNCCSPAVRTSIARRSVSGTDRTAEANRPDTVEIPGGKALVGTDNPIIRIDEEAPLRIVKTKPFRIDTTAVTNKRFSRFVEDTGYVTDAERFGNSLVFRHQLARNTGATQTDASAPWWHVVDGANWRSVYGPGSEDESSPDFPVVHVSWNDARAFAKWALGRLPTEAEWEHAARGGLADVRFPWGDREPNDTDYFPCNIWQGDFPEINTSKDGYSGLAPARSYEANGYGLYNMVGNTWEWMSQPFKLKSVRKSARQIDAGRTGFKLLKGGSFLCHASYCYRYRIAARTGGSPDSTSSHMGFRLVYDVA